MEADGGDYSKVKLVNMDVGDIVATLGHVADATWVYENWENQVLLEAARRSTILTWGWTPSLTSVPRPWPRPRNSGQSPEAVRKFLAVLDRAYQEVAAHPEETVLEVRDRMPEGVRWAADSQPEPPGPHSAG